MLRWSGGLLLAGTLAGGLLFGVRAAWVFSSQADPAIKVASESEKPGEKHATVDKDAPVPAITDAAAPEAPLQIPSDPAFDRFIDYRLLGQAVLDADSAAMTDAALQMAEGERILQRPNKALPAAQLLILAARLAADKQDKSSLTRLAKAAEAQSDKDLSARIDAAKKLAAQAREVDPAVVVNVQTVSPASFLAYRSYLQGAQAAKLTADTELLKQMEDACPVEPDLTPDQRENLRKLLAEARAAIREKPDAVQRTLGLLAAASREEAGNGRQEDNSRPDEEASLSLLDAGFEPYVDLLLLGDAWARLDAGLMTDVGLQLAEGERVLGRQHKANLTAQKVLATAVQVAGKQKDRAALERLIKAADSRGDKELAGQATSVLKLASASRDANPALVVSVEATSPDAFSLYRGYLQDIQAAQVGADRTALDQIDKELPNVSLLLPAQRAYLTKLSGEARAALPKDQPKTEEMTIALNKLANASRDWFTPPKLQDTHIPKPNFTPPKHLPNHGLDWSQWGHVKPPTIPDHPFGTHVHVNVNLGGQGNDPNGHTEQGPYGQGSDTSQFFRRPINPPSLPGGLW